MSMEWLKGKAAKSCSFFPFPANDHFQTNGSLIQGSNTQARTVLTGLLGFLWFFRMPLLAFCIPSQFWFRGKVRLPGPSAPLPTQSQTRQAFRVLSWNLPEPLYVVGFPGIPCFWFIVNAICSWGGKESRHIYVYSCVHTHVPLFHVPFSPLFL